MHHYLTFVSFTRYFVCTTEVFVTCSQVLSWWQSVVKVVMITWKQFSQKLMCAKTSERKRKAACSAVRLRQFPVNIITSRREELGQTAPALSFRSRRLRRRQFTRRRPWWKSQSLLKSRIWVRQEQETTELSGLLWAEWIKYGGFLNILENYILWSNAL